MIKTPQAAQTTLFATAVAAALQYRTQAPILDSLLNEVGLDGGSLAGLAKAVSEKPCRTGVSNAQSPHPNGTGDDGQAKA